MFLCSENKGVDQLCGYRTAGVVNAQLMDYAPMFLHMHKAGFLITLLMCSNEKKLNLTKYFLSFFRYGLYVHGGIDSYSRLIPYLRCSPFNTAKVTFLQLPCWG